MNNKYPLDPNQFLWFLSIFGLCWVLFYLDRILEVLTVTLKVE